MLRGHTWVLVGAVRLAAQHTYFSPTSLSCALHNYDCEKKRLASQILLLLLLLEEEEECRINSDLEHSQSLTFFDQLLFEALKLQIRGKTISYAQNTADQFSSFFNQDNKRPKLTPQNRDSCEGDTSAQFFDALKVNG